MRLYACGPKSVSASLAVRRLDLSSCFMLVLHRRRTVAVVAAAAVAAAAVAAVYWLIFVYPGGQEASALVKLRR